MTAEAHVLPKARVRAGAGRAPQVLGGAAPEVVMVRDQPTEGFSLAPAEPWSPVKNES